MGYRGAEGDGQREGMGKYWKERLLSITRSVCWGLRMVSLETSPRM